jgi:hypothetical protein
MTDTLEDAKNTVREYIRMGRYAPLPAPSDAVAILEALDSARAELAAVQKRLARYETIVNPAHVAVAAMAERDAAREALAKAERDNMCDACAGTGKPESGLHCQCLGSGKMSVAAETLRVVAHQQRERAESAERARDELAERLDTEQGESRLAKEYLSEARAQSDRLSSENARMRKALEAIVALRDVPTLAKTDETPVCLAEAALSGKDPADG